MKYLLDSKNRLFELACSGKRLPHLIVATVLSFVFVLVGGFGGGILALIIIVGLSIATGEVSAAGVEKILAGGNQQALLNLLLPNTALEQTIYLVFSFGPIFLLLWAWLALFEKRPFWTIGLARPGAGQRYLRGLLVGLLMFIASVGVSAVFGYIAIEEGSSSQPQGLAALGGVLLVFLGWVVQGSAEEALTRGWLLPVLGARYRPALGVIISSVIFAVFHSLNPNLNPVAILNLFLFGLFAALYALYEGGLWGVFSLHTAWNWAQGNLLGFEVSGGNVPGGTLFDLMEVGPDIVTGGPFGPEGGLAVTVVLVLSCVIIWLLSGRKENLVAKEKGRPQPPLGE
ncbi:MAG: CPBP family intramembrane metalloprotease [Anaerolineae bacterium]|nr:CPBP family intramembrane metalloprotease [Anaerolineae bacterium]